MAALAACVATIHAFILPAGRPAGFLLRPCVRPFRPCWQARQSLAVKHRGDVFGKVGTDGKNLGPFRLTRSSLWAWEHLILLGKAARLFRRLSVYSWRRRRCCCRQLVRLAWPLCLREGRKKRDGSPETPVKNCMKFMWLWNITKT